MPIETGIALAAKYGAPLIGKGLGKLFGGKSAEEKAAEAALELEGRQKDAFDLQDAQRLASEEVAHGNQESGRTNRADVLGDALGRFSGDFAQSADVRAKGQEARGFEGYKREFMPGVSQNTDVGEDFSKTLFEGVGNAGGEVANNYLKGLGADGGDGGGGEAVSEAPSPAAFSDFAAAERDQVESSGARDGSGGQTHRRRF